MITLMDGQQVYTNEEVDALLVEQKAQIDEEKASKSELADLVHTEVEAVIDTKVNQVAGTFDTAIDEKIATQLPTAINTTLASYDTSDQVTGKINTALADYDTSDQVTNKINTAIAAIPAGPSAMSTSEATALVNSYF